MLVISGTDGVQAHTQTLWQLLEKHRIPLFLFVNKMDLDGADKEKILSDLRQKLSGCCVDLAQPWESLSETAALCDEALLEALDTYGPEPKYPQDFKQTRLDCRFLLRTQTRRSYRDFLRQSGYTPQMRNSVF